MGIIDYPQAGTNRKLLRRQRAAERLQIQSRPYFTAWDSHAQKVLETKLTEFLGLCRTGAISHSNVYSAACNVLAPVAKIMGPQNHQHWLTRFNHEGTREFINPLWRSTPDYR